MRKAPVEAKSERSHVLSVVFDCDWLELYEFPAATNGIPLSSVVGLNNSCVRFAHRQRPGLPQPLIAVFSCLWLALTAISWLESPS